MWDTAACCRKNKNKAIKYTTQWSSGKRMNYLRIHILEVHLPTRWKVLSQVKLFSVSLATHKIAFKLNETWKK